MSAKRAVLGQKCPPIKCQLGTETYLGENGFVYKRLVDLDTGKTAIETVVIKVNGGYLRVSTGRPAIVRLCPGVEPPAYYIPPERLVEMAAANTREDARRLSNYSLYLKGKNPCVEKVSHMHKSYIPERTYDGWWERVD